MILPGVYASALKRERELLYSYSTNLPRVWLDAADNGTLTLSGQGEVLSWTSKGVVPVALTPVDGPMRVKPERVENGVLFKNARRDDPAMAAYQENPTVLTSAGWAGEPVFREDDRSYVIYALVESYGRPLLSPKHNGCIASIYGTDAGGGPIQGSGSAMNLNAKILGRTDTIDGVSETAASVLAQATEVGQATANSVSQPAFNEQDGAHKVLMCIKCSSTAGGGARINTRVYGNSQSSTEVDCSGFGPESVVLGAEYGSGAGSGQLFDGVINELIIYNANTPPADWTIDYMFGYFVEKWNL